MKSIKVSSLGFELNKSVPESVSEYDQLAKRENGCLEDAINSTLYRGTFAEFRDIFLHGAEADEANGLPAIEGVEKLTGIARKTKEVKAATAESQAVTAWDESEAVYFKRVVAAQFGGDADAAIAHFAEMAQQAMDRAAFDPSVKERKSAGPKTIAKTYIEIAKQAVEGGKGEKLAALLGQHLNRTVTLTGETEKDIATLAKAISDREAQKRAALKEEYAV